MKVKCVRCGYCCTLKVKLTASEIETIKKRGYENFYSESCLKQLENGDCIFLKRKDGKTSCEIYSIRPNSCLNYPPYPQNKPCKENNPAVRAYLYYWEK